MKRIIWGIFGCLMALNPLSSNALSQVKSAKIYFDPWYSEHRSAQHDYDIRKHPYMTKEITDETYAASLVNLLEAGKWAESPLIEDLSLVIDITYQDGTQESYFANGFEIFSTRTGKARINDAKFRTELPSYLER